MLYIERKWINIISKMHEKKLYIWKLGVFLYSNNMVISDEKLIIDLLGYY